MKTEIDITKFAAELAFGTANEQAELINTLGNELRIACKDEMHLEKQLCILSNSLNKQGINFILELAEFIKLRIDEDNS